MLVKMTHADGGHPDAAIHQGSRCAQSTPSQAKERSGAGDGVRTRDIQLGNEPVRGIDEGRPTGSTGR